MDVLEHNRVAWNRESTSGSAWTMPVDAEVIAAARRGDWSVILTPNRQVPREWFGALDACDLLCLASGGGQQAPVLAAAGARVTSFDLSDVQLEKDRAVAERDGLSLRCVRGDMADLSVFADASFDIVFHPVSNVFVPDVETVWRECARVLRPGGRLLAGFMNPAFFLFDHDEATDTGACVARHRLPYAEPDSLSPDARAAWDASGRAAEFGHSLQTQIGGQLAAGFRLAGLYEDDWDDAVTPLNRLMPVALATLALRAP
ncbi:MAG: class I SAM-dependent methyltransferase [Luteimonas sp.]